MKTLQMPLLLIPLGLTLVRSVQSQEFHMTKLPEIPPEQSSPSNGSSNIFTSINNKTETETENGNGNGNETEEQQDVATTRVVGGWNADKQRYPYFVYIEQRDNHLRYLDMCGGTLIRPDFVLTAAHCLHDHTHNIFLVANYTGISQPRHYQYSRWASDYGRASGYHMDDTGAHHNDLMIIKLDSPIYEVPLPRINRQRREPDDDDEVTLLGVGKVEPNGNWATQLQELHVDVIKHSRCNRNDFYDGLINETTMICAGEDNQGGCTGDSGGPLIKQGDTPDDDLHVGILSWGGLPCAAPKKPTVYTRVSHWWPFIKSTVCEYSDIQVPESWNCNEPEPHPQPLPPPHQDGSNPPREPCRSGNCKSRPPRPSLRPTITTTPSFAPSIATSLLPTITATAVLEEKPKLKFCFSKYNLVETKRGTIHMDAIKIGDQVLVSANGEYEAVYSFGHRHETARATYIRIHTDVNSRPLELTANHLLFTDHYRSTRASEVRVGDSILLSDHTLATAIRISSVERTGIYGPFTRSGRIVVNGVVASTYVAFQETPTFSIANWETGLSFHWVSHAAMAPFRRYCSLFGCSNETYGPTGLPGSVDFLLQLWECLMEQHPLVLVVTMVSILVLLLCYQIFEIMLQGPATLVMAVTIALLFQAQRRRVARRSRCKV